ncbi:MAG: hypothetical protein IJ048_13690 [Clostridia bacterium]|nr:hypothetical protein [Clostridia bacterium]
MDERTIWFDPDEWPDALGVMLHGGLARMAGTEICKSPAADRETELWRRLAEKGFYLLCEGDEAAVSWYSLPRLYVFARDAEGFFAADEPVTSESDAPVWHVGQDNQVTRAADNLRSLIDAVLAGQPLSRDADDGHRLFASWREAEAAGELFLRNDTPWKRGKR